MIKGSCKRVSTYLKDKPVHHAWVTVHKGGRSDGHFVIRGVGSSGWRFRKRASGWYLFKGDTVKAVFRSIPRKRIDEFSQGVDNDASG